MHEKRQLVKVAAITGLALVMTTGIALASMGKGTVTADALRLRSQANTNSAILNLAPRNSVVTLLEELDGWYKVSYGDQVGYMSADWLDVTQSGSEAVVGQGTVTADALNVRSGAGTVYNRLGLLYKGTSVMILEDCGNGWYKISGGGYTGYVSGEWVKVSGNSSSDSSDAQPIGTGTVNTACLNVRSGAGTGYSRVGYLYSGNSVSILKDCGNGWYQISYGSGSAYVCAEYISTGSDSGDSDGGEQTTGIVTADALNVRSGAGTGYSRLGLLYSGNSVTILGSSNGWYKISYGNGVGYVSAEYVSTKGGDNNSGSSSTSSIGEQAVALAKQQLGKPYVYGAAGPNGFDCSGLFYYIFNRLGVNIARGSSSQYYNSGTFVSVDEMQPGDLVYLFDPKYDYSGGSLPTTHVLMYIGNNTVLHASTTSNTVRTDTLFGGYYGNYVVAVKRMG
ncbi:MAG TPA: SH3 domain-containing protein [Candidatus Enterenecus avicola]|nr:SH3 domain-containing protein [Candidatus Enterenecus avicola]